MWSAHSPGRWGYDVQWGPECLHYFTINSCCTLYEIRGIAVVAAILMSMNMPEANARSNDHPWWKRKIRAAVDPFLQLVMVLTIDVIKCDGAAEPGCIVIQCLAQSIIHVHLSVRYGRHLKATSHNKLILTFLPFENRPWNAGQNSRVSHRHSRRSLWPQDCVLKHWLD